ncbi:hypothetical protein LTR08_003513 [Meristemomyces frigidus]|nr:hypothetical protein LTR08_003513 [Meristemomyces frigidus]
MQSIRQITRLNALELDKVIPPNASWHTDYRDTAYIHIGGLPFELSEGDILALFSQYGNPVHVNLVRDKDTGKSRGFAFLKYEDQRSCDLAVDNLGGAGVMGRVVSVDHARYTRKEGEVEGFGEEGRRKRRRTGEGSESEVERPMIKEELELAQLRREMDDEDPMKAYLIQAKQAEVKDAVKAVVKRKGTSGNDGGVEKHRRKHHRSRREDSGERDDDGHHRSTRHRADDDDEEGGRGRDNRTSRRERTATPDAEEESARRRRRRARREPDNEARDAGDDGRRERKSELRRAERDRSVSDRSRSREPYRRRK